MKNLRELNQIIDRSMNEIVISEKIKENISKQNKPGFLLKKLVITYGLTLCIIFSLIITVQATGMYKYIPGINQIINTPAQYFSIDNSISYIKDNKKIDVIYCYATDNTLKIALNSNIPIYDKSHHIALNGFNDVIVSDQNGQCGTIQDVGIEGNNDYWSGNFSFNLPDAFDLKIINLTIKNEKLNLELTQTNSDNLNLSTENGLTIAVVSNLVDDKLEIKLAGQTEDNAPVQSFKNVYLIDENNQRYEQLNIPTKEPNVFYFDAKNISGLKVIIPNAIVSYSDDVNVNSNIDVPQDEKIHKVNIPLKIHNIDFNIVQIQKYKESGTSNIRLPNNKYKVVQYNQYSLSVKIDKNSNLNPSIYDLNYSTEKNSLVNAVIDGVSIHYNDYKKYQEWNKEYKIINLHNINNNDKSIPIEFNDFKISYDCSFKIDLK